MNNSLGSKIDFFWYLSYESFTPCHTRDSVFRESCSVLYVLFLGLSVRSNNKRRKQYRISRRKLSIRKIKRSYHAIFILFLLPILFLRLVFFFFRNMLLFQGEIYQCRKRDSRLNSFVPVLSLGAIRLNAAAKRSNLIRWDGVGYDGVGFPFLCTDPC